MATGVLLSSPIVAFLGNNGQPAVNGSVLTQVGGINTATYQDSALTTPLPNPIPLNSRGEVSTSNGVSSQCFLTPNVIYTFTLYDGPNATGTQLWSAPYVYGITSSSTILSAVVGPAASGVPLTVNSTLATNVGILVTGSFNSTLQANVQNNASSGTAVQAGIDLQDSGSTGTLVYSSSTATATGTGTTLGVDGRVLTVATNTAAPIQLAINGTVVMRANGLISPTLVGYGPVAAALVDMTPDNGTWTSTLSGGFTSNPSGTIKWRRSGNFVILYTDAALTGTSNATTDISASGLPAAVTPGTARQVIAYFQTTNGNQLGMLTVNTNNTLTLQMASGSFPVASVVNGWPTSGPKGLAAGWCVSYPL